MKAIVRDRYGGPEVLRLEDVPAPEPAEGRVLVRVRAASVNPLEWHMLTGTPYLVRLQAGLRAPKQRSLGSDVAGVVEAVGPGVTGLKPGDEVFGDIWGSYAEFATGRAENLAVKPPGVSFEHAATVPVAGLTALQGLRDKARVEKGQHVLVNGASGGVGTFAVQIAKAMGAEVTGVCSSRNVEMVRSIGADHAVDYTREDFAAAGLRYDVMLDAIGNRSLGECRSVLRPGGTYVLVGGPKHRFLGPMRRLVAALAISPVVSQRMVGMLASANRADLDHLGELMAKGAVTPVIDGRFALADAAAALRHIGEGHAQGKSVILVS